MAARSLVSEADGEDGEAEKVLHRCTYHWPL